MSTRPTFFLSSTIHDFRDLRSAIKFSLEARGCRVLASEFNDFTVDAATHSYETCLSNIAQADYFVLLIGSRVGGWFDEPNRVSITQQEYREAYRMHREKGLRIVTLARAEVWQVREDRKALTKHLAGLGLTDLQRRQIADYPSKFADDAAFLSDFLSEVGRNLETATAVREGTAKPTGNWIFPFSTYKEVEDVLQPLTFSGTTAHEASYRTALQYELVELTSRLLLKHDGEPVDPRIPIFAFWKKYPIDTAMRSECVTVDVKDWSRFSVFMFRLLGVKIEPVVIRDALTSSSFLEYEAAKRAYVPTAAYDLLSRLLDEIAMFNRAAAPDTFELINEFSPKRTGLKQGQHHIPAQRLAILMALGMRWFNILSICEALARNLDGQPLNKPNLMPFSPIRGLQQQIDKENVTPAETRAFLGLGPARIP